MTPAPFPSKQSSGQFRLTSRLAGHYAPEKRYPKMKRSLLPILAVLAFIALAVFIFLWARHDSHAPRFVPGNPASIPPIGQQQYDFLADVPFENDRLWILTYVRNRYSHLYLYDLRQKKILGELFNADSPSLSSRDNSRLLVRGFGPVSFRESLANLLRVIGIRLPGASQRIETFWILDTSRNSAKEVDSLSQYSGAGSTWHPSPDFRYGYTMPTTSMQTAIYLCDPEQASLKPIPIRGYPCGWWDEHDILIDMGNDQFDLLDISTQTTRSLYSPADFQKLLAKYGVTNTLPVFATIANWNGKSFDFYFGLKDRIMGLTGSNSCVLRASADSPQLTLLYPEFQFRWGGHFDRTGKQYLYPGERGPLPGHGSDGAVYLRDLTSGAVSTIASTNNPGVYSNAYPLQRFYGNEVIYVHDGRLRRVGLNGSNDTPILPSR